MKKSLHENMTKFYNNHTRQNLKKSLNENMTKFYNKHKSWSLKSLHKYDNILKHRKNCECCPVSQLIVRKQRLSWIQVLNCLYCNQCLKCPDIAKVFLVRSGHLITLNKYHKGHKSLESHLEWQGHLLVLRCSGQLKRQFQGPEWDHTQLSLQARGTSI